MAYIPRKKGRGGSSNKDGQAVPYGNRDSQPSKGWIDGVLASIQARIEAEKSRSDAQNALTGQSGPNGLGFGSLVGNVPSNYSGPYSNQAEDVWGSQQGDTAGALNTLGSGNFADFLNAFLNDPSFGDELRGLFMQSLFQYGMTSDQRKYDQLLTQDQRAYDWSLLQDSRLYDSPTNQLARLMGAGISRDAAIQILSGSAGGSGFGSSGSPVTSAVPSTGSMAAPGQVANQRAANLINSINMIAGLVSQGIDMNYAISQAQIASNQAYMTSAEVNSFKGINDITDAFNRAVLDGTLSVDDVQGLRTADDYYKWITDHADTNLVKPLIDNGSVQSVFGSTIGRQMMNKHLTQTREGRDSGKLFDSFVRQQEAAARIADYNADEEYYNVQLAIGELSKQDVEIQNLWNDVWNGNIQLEIAGKQLKLLTYDENQAKTQNDIFNAVYNGSRSLETLDTRNLGSGAGMVAFAQWDELYRTFCKAYACSGTQERRDIWERFYLNNVDAAKLMAGIKLQMTQTQSNAMNANLHPNLAALISLYQIGNLTGAFDLINFTAETTEKALMIDALGKRK